MNLQINPIRKNIIYAAAIIFLISSLLLLAALLIPSFISQVSALEITLLIIAILSLLSLQCLIDCTLTLEKDYISVESWISQLFHLNKINIYPNQKIKINENLTTAEFPFSANVYLLNKHGKEDRIFFNIFGSFKDLEKKSTDLTEKGLVNFIDFSSQKHISIKISRIPLYLFLSIIGTIIVISLIELLIKFS